MLKNLLILERSSDVLTFEKDNSTGEYILEGIFGELGKKNKNGRIYNEEGYLPQIEALQDKIKKSKLMGELDHPQNFDIALKNVSHVIEEITYDRESRLVRGRIRLLNTDAGKQAKALVDDGIPLHISSRAAGAVGKNGLVEMKKLFTYDLVADPGFENAQLNRVNEAFGFENDGNISIFEINSDIPGENSKNSIDKYSNTNENNTPKNMNGLIKEEDFNTYSKHIAEQLNSLKKEVNTIKSLKESSKESSNENSHLEGYLEKIRIKMNEMFSYMDVVTSGVNGVITEVNQVIEHNNHIVESVETLKDYVEYTTEKTDYGIQYMEENAKKTNHIIEHNNYLAENLSTIANKLNEDVSNISDYSEYLKTNIETVGQYGDYTSENVNKLKKSLNSINEDRAKEIEDKINKMGEPQPHSLVDGKSKEKEKKELDTPVEESFDNDKYKNELTEKLDMLIESAQKQTADFKGDLHFLRFLNESERNQYFALNENVQSKIIGKTKQHTYTSNEDVQAIIESVITPVDNTPMYLKNLPSEYRSNWETASQDKQNQIIAESKSYSLTTAFQIENFWQTRDFRENAMQIDKINESSQVKEKSSNNDVWMDWFGSELKAKFQK